MATKTWAGGTGTWDNAAGWLPQSEPGISDDVVIGAGATVALTSGVVEVRPIGLAGPTAVLELRSARSGIDTVGYMLGTGMVGGGIVLAGSSDATQPGGLSGFQVIANKRKISVQMKPSEPILP